MIKKTGFTLIELLIVVGIVGVLSGIILLSVNQARDRTKITKAEGEVDQIRKAAAILELDSGQWPGHLTAADIGFGVSGNEIWDLTAPEAGIFATDGGFAYWSGPYIRGGLVDPWGNNYFFDPDYDIDPGAGQIWAAVFGSFGPNGVGQNVYDSDNIIEILEIAP